VRWAVLLDIPFFLLRITFVPFFIREVIQRRKVTIILYHNPDPLTVDRHFTLLKRRYNIISLKNFIDAKRYGRTDQLPPKSLIITFDDGYKTNYKILPIFKKHKIMPTIFICSSIVGTNRHYWFIDSKGKLDNKKLKILPDVERVRLLRKIGFEEEKEYDSRQALSVGEINEMKDSVDFQSHTMFHPCLARCTIERARQEIRDSRQELMEKYGINVFALSYPNGDYSSNVIRLAEEVGYECGITVDLDFNDKNTDLFRLKRICLRGNDGASELIVRATGLWDHLKKLVTPPRHSDVFDNQ
jgi:peptidoglycan/xylan/chitin deacetylase (PgdA/CDA1 family)